MRFLGQLGSLDFADGSTWQRADDDLPAAAPALPTQGIGMVLVS